MQVLRIVGMDVVVAMMRRPPERSALDRRATDDGENKLHDPPRFERAVRKIAVVTPGQRKDAQCVKKHGDRYRQPTPADEEDAEAGNVHANERNRAHPIDTVSIFFGKVFLLTGRAEPKEDGREKTARTGYITHKLFRRAGKRISICTLLRIGLFTIRISPEYMVFAKIS